MKVYEFKYAFLREEIECIDAASTKLLDEILDLLERRIEKVTDEIDFDSVDDFDGVFDERIIGGGGHPWGIVRGSSRTRVSLYPEKTDKGYIFRLAGNPNWSVMELIKCYLTLKRLNFPVYFSCPQATIKYLSEEDLVGFVPVTRTPVYCQCEFNVRVEDFRQYWESDYGKIKDLIQWQEIDEVKLKQ